MTKVAHFTLLVVLVAGCLAQSQNSAAQQKKNSPWCDPKGSFVRKKLVFT
jgi:hypothetical protein